MTPTRRWIVACVVLAFVARAAFAVFYWTHQPLTEDEHEYLALARSLSRGEGFHYPADEPVPGTAQRFGRAPGYPAFLALLHVTQPVDHVPVRVQIAQAAVGALGVWMLAAMARRSAGERGALAAAAAAALYPPLVWLPAYALSEALCSTVMIGAALALDLAVEAKEAQANPRLTPAIWLFVAAVLTGAAILVRPAMIFFVPFAGAWLLVRDRHRQVGRGVARAAVFTLIVMLCVLPWMARNAQVYGRWMIASEGGVTFWTGNNPLAGGEGDLAANPDLKRADLAFRAAHPGLTPEQLEPLYYRDAFDWITAHPLAWAALLGRKLVYTIVPGGPSYAVHSPRYRLASIVSYLLALVAAIAGLWHRRSAARRGAVFPAPVALWLAAAATIAAGLVFMPQERFRIPVVDPALIVTGAFLAARVGRGTVPASSAHELSSRPVSRGIRA